MDSIAIAILFGAMTLGFLIQSGLEKIAKAIEGIKND